MAFGASRIADGRIASGVFFVVISGMSGFHGITGKPLVKIDPTRPPNPLVLGVVMGLSAASLAALAVVLALVF